MAKTVGLSRNIKMQWLNKAVALLDDNLEEAEYKSALNEYLGYEIGSAINIRKTREILMHLWFYKDAETDDIRELALSLIILPKRISFATVRVTSWGLPATTAM